jgi:hypothetical protein
MFTPKAGMESRRSGAATIGRDIEARDPQQMPVFAETNGLVCSRIVRLTKWAGKGNSWRSQL